MIVAAAVVALGLAGLAASRASASVVGLLKVRLGGDAQQTRIVMDLDQAATGKLIADGSDGRAVVVLSNVSALGGLGARARGS